VVTEEEHWHPWQRWASSRQKAGKTDFWPYLFQQNRIAVFSVCHHLNRLSIRLQGIQGKCKPEMIILC
jgi:hypothetical protein